MKVSSLSFLLCIIKILIVRVNCLKSWLQLS